MFFMNETPRFQGLDEEISSSIGEMKWIFLFSSYDDSSRFYDVSDGNDII